MRNSKILLICLRALANETAKNLVLAGIGSLTVLDPDPVTEEDLCSQFFVQEEHLGMNVSLYPGLGSCGVDRKVADAGWGFWDSEQNLQHHRFRN